jgi:prepilin-type N-terminal cleavage/methylation domain-containing protein
MRRKKIAILRSDHRGFSLIELVIVIAITAALAGILSLSVMGYAAKAKKIVLESNMSDFSRMVSIYSVNYPKNDWYDSWSHDGNGSLNNFIEQELEVINSGTYENNISLANPYSNKMSILDYDKTLNSGDGYRLAVFLTANASYSYAATANTQNLIGTIVAYFKVTGTTTDHIEIYYVNKDGTKSDSSITID